MAQLPIQELSHQALQAHQAGRLREAEELYRQILVHQPEHRDATYNLGMIALQLGRNDIAVDLIRRILALNPNFPEAHSNLGIALKNKGQLDEAIAAYRQAITLRPDYADAHRNLGNALKDKGEFDQAIAAYRRAIALRPNYAQAHNNLGNVLADKDRLDEAIAAYRQAIALIPNLGEAHYNLGNALKAKGQLDEAIAAYRQALALKPNWPQAHSNLAFTLHYHPSDDVQAIAEEHRRWNHQHAEPLRKFIQPHFNDPSPDRRLKLGYVSADFRKHPVGRFLLPLLEQHDHGQFEIICYSDVVSPDEITAHLQSCANHWREIKSLSDIEAAGRIRDDGIDILVDLTGHTGNNRLLVFARKPAPVQVSYLSYQDTTGLSTIDYRLTDRHLDPNEADDKNYVEKLMRLAGTYWCYQQSGEGPAVSELPASTAGYITFGCLNNYCKVTPKTLETWAGLLSRVGDAHLLLHSPVGSHRDLLMRFLEDRGVSADRIELVGRQSFAEYFKTYGSVDIALDPFPYAGVTTTCDALWMGVPVITLAGGAGVARSGVSILNNAGLPELAATTAEEYIRLAATLAKDLPRLRELRSTLRRRMEQSPLMDAPKYARDIEAVYRRMWRNWCEI